MKPQRRALLLFCLVLLGGLALGARGAPGTAARPDDEANNAGWEEVGVGSASGGGISNNSGSSSGTSLAIAPNGTYYVAWADDTSGNYEIYVKKWTGGATWESVGSGSASGGGISNNSAESSGPSLAIAPNGRPVVVWQDKSDGDWEIYAMEWTGSTWAPMGGSSSGGGVSDNSGDSLDPSLAIAPDGTPMVTWNDNSGSDWEIYAKMWIGSSWAPMGASASGGGISDNTGFSEGSSLAISPNGTPYVAWYDNSGENQEIYAKWLDGSIWKPLGTSASAGGVSDNSSDSRFPSIAVPVNGKPIIAWYNYGGNDWDIYAKEWNGSAWQPFGNSASGDGVSDNTADSYSASLAIGSDGKPIIAWNDKTNGDFEIYLRRWNGSVWEPMDDGSASGGGVSDNSGDSFHPSLAVAPDGTPILAWKDFTDGDAEIYLRRWDGGISCYSLTIIVNGSGSVSAAPDLECYEDGAQVTLTATPTAGHTFAGWSGDLTGSANPVVLTMNADLSVTANFIHQCYTLSRSHTGSGGDPTATPANSTGCSAGRYTSGQAISLSASPVAGWRVKNWSGTANNASTATTNSLTMPAANHTVSVAYELIPVTTFRAYMPQVVNVPLTCFAGPDEREPNNTGAAANGPLCPGVVFRGLPDDLWDIFYLETARAGDLTVTLTESFGGGMQLHLYTGAVGGSPYYQDTDDDDGLQAALRGAPAGRYYIAVYTETPNPAEIRRYNLRTTLP